MKFPFRRRKVKAEGGAEGGAVSGVKARIQLRLLSQLKWEPTAPRRVKAAASAAEKQPRREKAREDLETLQGCTEFLKSSGLNTRALAHAARMVDHFKSSYQMGDSSLPDEFRIEAWKGTLRRIVRTLVEQLRGSNPRLGEEPELWKACETWVLGSVYDKIMGACKQMFGQKDRVLDESLARLDNLDPIVLGVRSEFKEFVLGEALLQFRMINRGRTPLEKAICLRKTIHCIIGGIQSVVESCSGTSAEKDGLLPCTDDLLSFMLLLMARSRVKNLQANACYMDNFLSLQMEEESGELAYHVTNFVAACNYLNSGEVEKLVASAAPPPPPVVATPVYSRSYSFEPEVCTVSGGEVFTVNVFDGQRGSEIELRSFSEKSLGNKSAAELNLGSFARDSPEFILAPTYQ